jgi:FtsP/CotA-like multicopper oxidase with cupredoxin domain
MLAAMMLPTIASRGLTQLAPARFALAANRPAPQTIDINDNRRPAGRLERGVLTVRLEARNGMWYPEGPDGTGLPVAAFAEEGRPMQNPGPLIRVTAGTTVRVIVRNTLAAPLTLFGLGAQRGISGDTTRVAPGSLCELTFVATTPGTYYYAGKTSRGSVLGRGAEDSQLNGAIVVDPAGAPRQPNDRLFMISWWFTIDSTSPSGLGRATLAINGRSWPHTEPLAATQGDSLHWRWINLTELAHPLHLHGFYFQVDGAGNGATYTTYAPAERRGAVTELMTPGTTMALTWSPSRPGNWIVHCHFASHISHHVALGTVNGVPDAAGGPGEPGGPGHAHTGHQMAGLVLGIRVAPRGARPAPARNARAMRLIVRSRPNVYGTHPGYAYALGGTPEETDTSALTIPGPTLVLEKDQPVAITVVNRSHEPAAVHWHGIELESFPDGVPGWSGSGASLLPAIQPGDSLTVRFTPPRAGTFMYHSHFNEVEQIASGLYGAIVVVDRGRRFDPETDRVMVLSDGGPTVNLIRGPFPPALLNGSTQPAPLELRAGVTYRLRLINIRGDYAAMVALLDGTQPVEWRMVAKDGADLPAAQATVQPARLVFSPGEIHDVELTPRAPGVLTLRFGTPRQGPIPEQMTSVEVRVR